MPTETYRERICAQLKRNFESVTAGAPADDPYLFSWDVCQRAPLQDIHKAQPNALAILDQNDVRQPWTNQTLQTLQLFLEFSSHLQDAAVKPSTHANRVLGDLVRRVGQDPYLFETGTNEQLALNCRIAGASHDVDSFLQKRVEGTVILEVQFRTSERDDRSYV